MGVRDKKRGANMPCGMSAPGGLVGNGGATIILAKIWTG